MLLFSLVALPANAANVVSGGTSNKAYMDIETAPESMKAEILSERKKIIYSTSWSAPGEDVFIFSHDVEASRKSGHIEGKKFVRMLPEFYDVFPSDWEIPKT